MDRMIFLVDPDGEILAAYAIDADPDQVASATAQQIENFKRRNPGWKAKVDPQAPCILTYPHRPAWALRQKGWRRNVASAH